ncbi:MAG TPA: hypothetical protein VGM41_02050 [Chitinophagaceae bacterium]|jgi:hypothetical protein
MKKIAVVALLAFLGSALHAAPTDVSQKVLKIFKETFSNAKEVKWQELQDSYSVSFSQDGIQSKVVYDLDGNMLSSLRYYSPDRLPMNVFSKLKKKYDSRTFFGVTESATDHDVVYYVKMYDAKNWYTIKIDSNGNMEQYEKMKRADIGQF